MADVLRISELARVKLTRNDVVLYNQVYSPVDESYTEHAGDRVVLAANTSIQQANLGGVSTAENLMLVTDQEIKVGINTQTYLWTVKKNGAILLKGSFSTLYFQNQSTAIEAVVEFLVTD